jgi:hypothetical protein
MRIVPTKVPIRVTSDPRPDATCPSCGEKRECRGYDLGYQADALDRGVHLILCQACCAYLVHSMCKDLGVPLEARDSDGNRPKVTRLPPRGRA